MLTPAQVIPFLSHADAEVRSLARRYLISANDPAPTTAEDFWAAADRAAPEEAGAFLDRLGFVPQTENSVKRLLDELPKADPATADSLRRTLERVEFDVLKSQWESIKTNESVAQTIREHLQTRLDLADEPAETAWDRMMNFTAGLGNRDLNETEELEIDRVIESVARHPDLFRDRVLSALRDSQVKGWVELCVVDLAGEMKLDDAAEALLDKLKVDEADFLWQVTADSLVRIGSEKVIQQIVERFDRDGEGFRISASEVLGRIKRPEAQAAIIRLLADQKDSGIASGLIAALAELLPDDPETFALLRDRVRDNAYDRRILHLDESVLSLSTMTGLDLPEAAEWREAIEQRRAKWAMGTSNVATALQSPGSLGPSTLYAAPPGPDLTGWRPAGARNVRKRPRSNRVPFKNTKAKPGRNDPCLCGSGKKYKKCCGRS